jgi:hypothetical protein
LKKLAGKQAESKPLPAFDCPRSWFLLSFSALLRPFVEVLVPEEGMKECAMLPPKPDDFVPKVLQLTGIFRVGAKGLSHN